MQQGTTMVMVGTVDVALVVGAEVVGEVVLSEAEDGVMVVSQVDITIMVNLKHRLLCVVSFVAFSFPSLLSCLKPKSVIHCRARSWQGKEPWAWS